MSVVENMAKHADEMEAEVAKMQKAMTKSKTGMVMLSKSQEMAQSEEMMGLMATIGDPDFPEEERMTLAKYMGEMMQKDPVDGLDKFAFYLEEIVKDPNYKSREEYYMSIADAAYALGRTDLYYDYITTYNQFNEDKSPEAEAARKATEAMQEKMKKWANG